MRLRQVVLLLIVGILVLLVFKFKYAVKVEQNTGDRTVTYGITNLFNVAYTDKAVKTAFPRPYQNIPAEQIVETYKKILMILIVMCGAVFYLILA